MMEWILWLQFIAFGSFWFWTLILCESVAIIYFLEHQKPGRLNMSIFLFLFLLWVFSDIPVVSYVFHNPVRIVATILGYLVAGTLWSIAKWYFFVLNVRDDYYEARKSFCEEQGIAGTEWTPEQKQRWEKYFARQRSYFRSGVDSFGRPIARENKERIVMWMCYWPWSMVWTILNDPFRRLFLAIYEYVQGIHDSISRRLYRNFQGDFLTADERSALQDAQRIAQQDRGLADT